MICNQKWIYQVLFWYMSKWHGDNDDDDDDDDDQE